MSLNKEQMIGHLVIPLKFLNGRHTCFSSVLWYFLDTLYLVKLS